MTPLLNTQKILHESAGLLLSGKVRYDALCKLYLSFQGKGKPPKAEYKDGRPSSEKSGPQEPEYNDENYTAEDAIDNFVYYFADHLSFGVLMKLTRQLLNFEFYLNKEQNFLTAPTLARAMLVKAFEREIKLNISHDLNNSEQLCKILLTYSRLANVPLTKDLNDAELLRKILSAYYLESKVKLIDDLTHSELLRILLLSYYQQYILIRRSVDDVNIDHDDNFYSLQHATSDLFKALDNKYDADQFLDLITEEEIAKENRLHAEVDETNKENAAPPLLRIEPITDERPFASREGTTVKALSDSMKKILSPRIQPPVNSLLDRADAIEHMLREGQQANNPNEILRPNTPRFPK